MNVSFDKCLCLLSRQPECSLLRHGIPHPFVRVPMVKQGLAGAALSTFKGVNFFMLLAKESSNHMSTMLALNKVVRVQPLG